MKKYSKKDLIRKPSVRIIVGGIALISIIVGLRGWDYNRNWKGFILIGWGYFLLYKLQNAYERLLKEKNDKTNKK